MERRIFLSLASACALAPSLALGAAINLPPAADAYVRKTHPTVNYGNEGYLFVSGNSTYEYRSYLRFDLRDLRKVNKAMVVLCPDGLVDGKQHYVHLVSDNSWSETGINWQNAPAFDASPLGSWISDGDPYCHSADVTAAVEAARNSTAKQVTFAIKGAASTVSPAYYRSRQAPADRQMFLPYLAVDHGLSVGPDQFPLEPRADIEVGEDALTFLLNWAFREDVMLGTGSTQVRLSLRNVRVDFEPGILKLAMDANATFDLTTVSRSAGFRLDVTLTRAEMVLFYQRAVERLVLYVKEADRLLDENAPEYVKSAVRGYFDQFAIYPRRMIKDVALEYDEAAQGALVPLSQRFPLHFSGDFITSFSLEKDLLRVSLAPEMITERLRINIPSRTASSGAYGRFKFVTNYPCIISKMQVRDVNNRAVTFNVEAVSGPGSADKIPLYTTYFTLPKGSQDGISGTTLTLIANVSSGLANTMVRGKFNSLSSSENLQGFITK